MQLKIFSYASRSNIKNATEQKVLEESPYPMERYCGRYRIGLMGHEHQRSFVLEFFFGKSPNPLSKSSKRGPASVIVARESSSKEISLLFCERSS